MSHYPAVPPPSYGSTSPSPKSPNAQIYPGNRYHDEPGSSAGIYNQPAQGDVPDDFKVFPSHFHWPDTLSDLLHSMVSQSRRAPLRFVLRLFERCTLSCVCLQTFRTALAWLMFLLLLIVTQIVGILELLYVLAFNI